MDRARYPFSAVVGQERAKQALLCLAVEPRIGGVLLCGEKGTAKSTLVRAMGGLEGVHLVELPVSTTEDMLLGGVELETAVRTGRRQFQPGLLARADGAVLYADEINLLPAALSGALLDTLESGVCRVERDGISHTCPARFSLVGTMNPEEGTLRPQLLDRFGIYVSVIGETEPESRKEVVRRALAFETDPVGFCAQWARQEARLSETVASARVLLPQVSVGEAEEQAACLLARQANAAGHRAELSILHTARALAALAGRTYLNMTISIRRRSWPCPTVGGRGAKRRHPGRRRRQPPRSRNRTAAPGTEEVQWRTSSLRRKIYRQTGHSLLHSILSRASPGKGWSRGKRSMRCAPCSRAGLTAWLGEAADGAARPAPPPGGGGPWATAFRRERQRIWR